MAHWEKPAERVRQQVVADLKELGWPEDRLGWRPEWSVPALIRPGCCTAVLYCSVGLFTRAPLGADYPIRSVSSRWLMSGTTFTRISAMTTTMVKTLRSSVRIFPERDRRRRYERLI
jgi:hypothetical protein